MLFFKFIISSLFIFSVLTHVPKDKNIFVPPVTIPVQLSSNFGELRIDHFHSGIDIKTQGVTGKEIVSCAEGFIYRITVSPSGFGKALYVKHPSGYSTVYAHLDRFTPAIESYVRAVQYERKSFAVNLFPSKDKFPVGQGELIAYSGNSGSSGGPHLHFEVRESDSELPVNPLLFEIGASDNITPVIEKIAIYPIGKNSFVNNSQSRKIINAKGSQGKFGIAAENEIIVSGRTGFGIKIHDLINGSVNKCAAYSITLEVDSLPVYKYVMDGFPFTDSRYINSHIDYETWVKDNIRIQKAFVLPNDKLSAYKSHLNRGIYNFNDDQLHKIRIIVTDAHNNKSTVSFNVRSVKDKPQKIAAASENTLSLMPYNRVNRFTTDDISVSIPSGALYDTLAFEYVKKPGTPIMLSDLHSVHNNYTPLHKAYTLQVKPTFIPAGKESKLLLVKMNDNISKSPVSNSTFTDGFLKADVMSFGNYFVGIDTISPSITAPGLSSGANLAGRKELRIKIKDEFSGIKSYEPTIDGKWALFEYDPKNEVLIYSFDPQYLSKGTKHSLNLKVLDNRDNESNYSCEFTW